MAMTIIVALAVFGSFVLGLLTGSFVSGLLTGLASRPR